MLKKNCFLPLCFYYFSSVSLGIGVEDSEILLHVSIFTPISAPRPPPEQATLSHPLGMLPGSAKQANHLPPLCGLQGMKAMCHYTMDHLPRSLCHGPLALTNGTLSYVFLLTVKKTGLRERSSARALTVKNVEPSYEKMGQSRGSDQMKVFSQTDWGPSSGPPFYSMFHQPWLKLYNSSLFN